MNKDKENSLVPELRFPEFRNDGEWNSDKVGNTILTITPPKKLTSINYQEDGIIPIIDQSQTYYCGWTNDKEALISNHLPLIIFGDHTCILKITKKPFAQGADGIKIIKPKDILDTLFLYHFLQYNPVKQEEYKRHFSILKEKLVLFPNKKTNEQQKIADCLSSLDDIITAQTQKLDLLKDHKKGLMQNLFPQEGETVPKFRFKEFEKDEKWQEKKLGDKEVSCFITEKISITNLNLKNYVSTENMLPDFGGITIASKLPSTGNFTKFLEGDILISNIRPYLRKVWKSDKQGGTSNDVIVFRAGKNLINEFLSYIIKNEGFINYIMKSAKGVKMPRGDKESMQNYSILIPNFKEEQQKIADCLSSLDDQIQAQSQKIEQLKLHKKGLMQQLFPTIN